MQAKIFSRFLGTTPLRVKLFLSIGVILFVALFVTAGILFWHGLVWKWEALRFAPTAGSVDASNFFARGRRVIFEMKSIDESENYEGKAYGIYEWLPTGRRQDSYEIWYVFYSPNMGRAHRQAQEAYVKAFNQRMRIICDNPQWFGPDGKRLPDSPGDTNRPKFKPVKE